jgi:hypothetical protein
MYYIFISLTHERDFCKGATMRLKPLEIKIKLMKMTNERGEQGVSVAEAARAISGMLTQKYGREIKVSREVLSKVIHDHPNTHYPIVREGLADFLNVPVSKVERESSREPAEVAA